jgi:hypothetical protein
MGLHSLGVSCLRKNLEKLIIGQEEETWEGTSLCLKIVLQALLDFIKLFIVVLEFTKKGITTACIKHESVFFGSEHCILPELVHLLELFGLIWKLLLDIFSIENILEIHPGLLEDEPLINAVRDVAELLLPLLNFFSDLSDIFGAHGGLNCHLMILKQCDKLVNLCDEESILGISVPFDSEISLIPNSTNLINCFEDACFSCGESRNLFHSVEMLIDSLLKKLVESEVQKGRWLAFDEAPDLNPMLLLHRLVS